MTPPPPLASGAAPPAAPGHRTRTTLAALLALLAACGSGEPEATVARPRNVVLVITDTLRADRLGCYGYERSTSPTIDALAARGTRFARNRSQGCWTVPSMISMMSGLYVTKEETALPPGQATLGQTLARAGIPTAAFIANPVVSEERGFSAGYGTFEVSSDRAHDIERAFESWYGENEEALSTPRGFFAWLHFIDPHHPYEPLAKDDVFHDRRPDGPKLLPRWVEGGKTLEGMLGDSPREELGESVLLMNRASNLYDGEVHAVDKAVARLLAFLDAQGLAEDTLVIFAADHGEMLYEHPHYPYLIDLKMKKDPPMENGVRDYFAWGHRAWFHEELWNTPLIFSGPGFAPGVVSQDLSCNLDLYPTILDAFDVPAISPLDGQSLLGNARPEREEVFAYGFDTTAVFSADGLKLIEFLPEHFLLREDAPAPIELFDHAQDRDELANLAERRPEDAARLQAAIAAWRKAHERETITHTSESDQQALGALGYVDDSQDQPLAPTEGDAAGGPPADL